MDARARSSVRERAANKCEYCGLPQHLVPLVPFHIEHIISKQHGGTDAPENLALVCYHCNLHKGPNLTELIPRPVRSLLCFTHVATCGTITSRSRGL